MISDLPIDTHLDLPGNFSRENAVENDNPTPLIYLRGGNIITGQKEIVFSTGKISRKYEHNRDGHALKSVCRILKSHQLESLCPATPNQPINHNPNNQS